MLTNNGNLVQSPLPAPGLHHDVEVVPGQEEGLVDVPGRGLELPLLRGGQHPVQQVAVVVVVVVRAGGGGAGPVISSPPVPVAPLPLPPGHPCQSPPAAAVVAPAATSSALLLILHLMRGLLVRPVRLLQLVIGAYILQLDLSVVQVAD